MNMTVTEFKSSQHVSDLLEVSGIPDDQFVQSIRSARVAAIRGATDSRSRSLVLTKLDEALLWWTAALGESRPKDRAEPPHPAEGTRVVIVSRGENTGSVESGTVIGSSVDGRLVVRDGSGLIRTLLHVDSIMPGAVGWDAA